MAQVNMKAVNNPIHTDEYEANSRIIQRLTAVGIIVPEDLTESQQDVIFELCGLSKLKTSNNVVTVQVEPYSSRIGVGSLISDAVMEKFRNVSFSEVKDKTITIRLSSSVGA